MKRREEFNRNLCLSLLVFFVVMVLFMTSCVDDIDSQSSEDPFGAGIIGIESNPDSLFGNANGTSEIEVNTEVFPDGSSVEFEITGSSTGISSSARTHGLPTFLRGCLIESDSTLSNGGKAFATYLAGINIASGALLASENPPIETVNVAVSITPPNGDRESDFVSVILNPVGIIPPEDIEVETRLGGDPLSTFVTLEFITIGIPPGTVVNFSLSRPDLGVLNPTSAPVVGSEEVGSVTTQYTTFNNTGGTQVIIASLVLPNPFDRYPSRCPDVPESDRRVEEQVVITQTVPEPTPAPTPSP